MGPPSFANIFQKRQREQHLERSTTENSPLLNKQHFPSAPLNSQPSKGSPPTPHSEFSPLRSFTPPLPPTPPHTDPKPLHLFHYAHNTSSLPAPRLIRKTNPRQTLIFVSGFCSNEDQPSARAGYGIHWNQQTHVGHRLEEYGGPETAERASLKGACIVVGLGLTQWKAEGFDSIVLATSSPYLTTTTTTTTTDAGECARRDREGNADLWRVLIDLLSRCDGQGVLVRFWLIGREDDEAAEDARGGALVAKNARVPDWRWLGVGGGS